MTNNLIQIYNGETKELIIREMTSEEQAERDAEIVLNEAKIAAREAKAEADAQAKAALLAQLGITEEQAKLLLS
jgi:regulator of protease activity HflC (stomatin/prohibitin superfamily)